MIFPGKNLFLHFSQHLEAAHIPQPITPFSKPTAVGPANHASISLVLSLQSFFTLNDSSDSTEPVQIIQDELPFSRSCNKQPELHLQPYFSFTKVHSTLQVSWMRTETHHTWKFCRHIRIIDRVTFKKCSKVDLSIWASCLLYSLVGSILFYMTLQVPSIVLCV